MSGDGIYVSESSRQAVERTVNALGDIARRERELTAAYRQQQRSILGTPLEIRPILDAPTTDKRFMVFDPRPGRSLPTFGQYPTIEAALQEYPQAIVTADARWLTLADGGYLD